MNFIIIVLLSILTFPISARVLVVSDSHGTGAFGAEFARLMEEQEHQVSFYAFGGSKAVDWIEGNNLKWGFWEYHSNARDRRGENRAVPKLQDLLILHKPSKVVIVLGTNMIWREPKDIDKKYIATLLEQVVQTGAECFWIGQPDLNPNSQAGVRYNLAVQTQLQEVVPSFGCQLIESWSFTNYPDGAGDGIHYDQIERIGASLAREWALKAFLQMDLK
jgi:hypothetical protein